MFIFLIITSDFPTTNMSSYFGCIANPSTMYGSSIFTNSSYILINYGLSGDDILKIKIPSNASFNR